MPKLDNDTLLLAFVGVTALAFILQTILLIAIFAAIRKAAKEIKEEAEDLRSAMMPIIYNARDLFTRISPKVESAVDDLAALTGGLRTQTAEMQTAAIEILNKLRGQMSRLDLMFTAVLDGVDRAGGFVAEVVSRPVRQMSSIMASIKAIIDSLRTPVPPSGARQTRPAPDRNIFV